MSVAISLVRAVVDTVERAGHDVDAFLAAAGLDKAHLEDSTSRMDVETYDRIQLLAVEWTQDPAFGLHMGELAGPGAFHLVGHLASQCRTVQEGLEACLRYYRIVADVKQPFLVDEGATMRLVYPFLRTHPVCDRLRAEFGMTRILALGRLFAGRLDLVTEVWFEHEAPPYASEYERVFEGKQRFGMPETGIVLERAALTLQQRYFDAELHGVIKDRAESALRRLDEGQSYSDKVHSLVRSQTLGTRPSAGQVARELQLTERSLRRRLEAEGTSFTAVMDAARAELAQRILGEAATTIKEAGFRMGFSDVSAFHRAFKRWTGLTPAEFRRGLASRQAQAPAEEEEAAGEPEDGEDGRLYTSEIRELRPVRIASSR